MFVFLPSFKSSLSCQAPLQEQLELIKVLRWILGPIQDITKHEELLNKVKYNSFLFVLESLHCLICTSTLSDSFEIDKSYQAMFLVLLKFCGKKIHYTHTTMTSKYFSLCSNICKNSVLNVYRLCSAA